ncbi:BZ3500_MvSof-1268-A1-R1_Chr1-3g02074 [Microbotryum saponariae]|uniref:Lysophospholipase n=1 Tax=Microbotryum saponariae TaxID=289078 RepID=A0A2X0MS58_9BASI|nr:BZ3500_MvSof-1268-A1-R1_Chr1-3g02074 [Microbotryum saponariae]SCZ95334.1 BZ3501_MvSof-1269-A2-R1_Chr1-3g01676 [Microbotryum saponariae]
MTMIPYLVLTFSTYVAAQATSYAPRLVSCPSTPLLNRTGSPLSNNQTLEPREAAYMSTRNNVLRGTWSSYLGNGNDTGYNTSAIINAVPQISLACSGGGLRASQYCVGTLAGLDARNTTNAGPLLQLSSYLSGLSGGSWAVSSVALNDLGPTDLYSMVLGLNGAPGWKLDLDILAPGGLLGISENKDYYNVILDDVRAKANAGFPVSLVDIWGRALSLHFFNGTTRNSFFNTSALNDQGLLFQSIKLTTNFQNGAMPYPIVVATSRVSEEQQTSGKSSTVISLSNTQFELSPYSFGSFDPTLSARVPMEYFGTFLNNSLPINSSACVNDYDNAGFVIGTSAALFNAIQNEFSSSTFTSLISTLINDLADIQPTNFSVPLVSNVPNSFFGFTPSTTTFESATNGILQLTDGGENGENVPLYPLLVKARAVDVIVAIDSSADTTYGWPNGTSLLATAERVKQYGENYTSFPSIPGGAMDFVQQGLNLRPTFFGCDVASGNVTGQGEYPILTIYLPNSPVPNSTQGYTGYQTNASTLTLNYDLKDTVNFLDASKSNALKGFQNVTAGQTVDPTWPLALKCATIDRARQRAGLPRSSACSAQFERYCWNSTIAPSLANLTNSTGGGVPATTESTTNTTGSSGTNGGGKASTATQITPAQSSMIVLVICGLAGFAIIA